ncbi:S-phase kinase-associated protein 1 homolog [Impatiens glandulifera]|uniref:S-phase kinase-associated protein 1 homolog n=1 Tax=Impatiens glandulifera TaxID=253017 RepID=UPI001FB0CA0E|nr:S-phase kinase-associated protein 1 homolog [Impatiens glandulifera]
MSNSCDDPKVVRVMSSDGKEFSVSERTASMSKMLKSIIEEDWDDVIPIPNVDRKTLAIILTYCDRRSRPRDESDNDDESNNHDKLMDSLDSKFLSRLNREQLMNLTLAANYLEVTHLLQILLKKHVYNIKDLTVEGVRHYFDIQTDFSNEEEARIRKETSWTFS